MSSSALTCLARLHPPQVNEGRTGLSAVIGAAVTIRNAKPWLERAWNLRSAMIGRPCSFQICPGCGDGLALLHKLRFKFSW